MDNVQINNCKLMLGDCFERMKEIPDGSVDSIVTDPPYGLSFMNSHWDYDVPVVDVWRECFRVLKPGAHLLSFGGTRTYHRMVVAIEDAGFEIRDQIMWVYGSGFPKSHNLKGDWQGFGTALKPAHEPICLARKPFSGTVAENVLNHGVGGLNIDKCRVKPTGESKQRTGELSQHKRYINNGSTNFAAYPGSRGGDENGRWPANFIHDGSDEVVSLFPNTKSGKDRTDTPTASKSGFTGNGLRGGHCNYGDVGSASRFFYCAKASKQDRDSGLEELPTVTVFKGNHEGRDMANQKNHMGGMQSSTGKNTHPTVKPTDLMRYLCRLITPPNGIILDPFMGSGSTGKAAGLENFGFIGIEKEQTYFNIAVQRINKSNIQTSLFELERAG